MAFFSDILKTDDKKFSQARVYLFASVSVYFLTIIIYLSHAFFGIISDVNVLINIMNSLQYMMLIFASYSLVGKGLSNKTINERLELHSKFAPPPMTPVNDGRRITPSVPQYQRGNPAYEDFYDPQPQQGGSQGGYRPPNQDYNRQVTTPQQRPQSTNQQRFAPSQSQRPNLSGGGSQELS